MEFQKKSLENKFDNEYEKLRTVNTDREQHLLDDFEWKLREVEQSCKRKLEEKEINATEKLNHIQTQLTSEIEKLKNEVRKSFHLFFLVFSNGKAIYMFFSTSISKKTYFINHYVYFKIIYFKLELGDNI